MAQVRVCKEGVGRNIHTSWERVSSFSESGASESEDVEVADEGGGGSDNFRFFFSRFGN